MRVEAWEGSDGYQGRLVFEPEAPSGRFERRYGPTRLRGQTREEVVSAAHDLPESWLKALLHSLG